MKIGFADADLEMGQLACANGWTGSTSASCYNASPEMRTKPIRPGNGRRNISARNIHSVVGQIATKFKPDKIILFGSLAHGNPGPESDVDLLVVMETPLRNSEQASQIIRAVDYHFAMDLIVRRPKELVERIASGDSFLREIVEKGKVVYARPD
jgi:predicted nucleotidyltransferase